LKTIEERTAERKTEVQPAPVAEPKVPGSNRGWLGVTVDAAVWVAKLQAGSPAQTAGFVQGDVITALDNTPVLDPVQLWSLVQAKEPGQEIEFRVLRDGQTESVVTRLEAPSPDTAEGSSWLGLTVESAVVVKEVLPGTPAQTAGLVQGDVLTGLNGERIHDPRELQQRIHEGAGDEVTLQLARGEQLRVGRVQAGTPGAPGERPVLY